MLRDKKWKKKNEKSDGKCKSSAWKEKESTEKEE